MKLRCYCCGTSLGIRFAIVTMAEGETDRVFTTTVAHAKNFQDTGFQVVVREPRVEPKNGRRK